MNPWLYSALAGLVVWCYTVCRLLPDPWGELWGHALLMLAVLVIVPLTLAVVQQHTVTLTSTFPRQILLPLQFPAACCLTWSLTLPPGPVAAAWSTPWVVCTCLIATAGGHGLIDQANYLAGSRCVNVGLLFSAVGGGWAFLDRAGIRPLGFEPIIVILTAIHFHFAGLALPVLTGLLALSLPGRFSASVASAVSLAVPGVAVGITASHFGGHPALEAGAALFMAAAGMGAALLSIRWALSGIDRQRCKICWLASGILLACGMILAALYGIRSYYPLPWMDIRWMRAWHGTLNSLACLAGLTGWISAKPLR